MGAHGKHCKNLVNLSLLRVSGMRWTGQEWRLRDQGWRPLALRKSPEAKCRDELKDGARPRQPNDEQERVKHLCAHTGILRAASKMHIPFPVRHGRQDQDGIHGRVKDGNSVAT